MPSPYTPSPPADTPERFRRDLARIVAALLGPDPWHADEIREHLYDTATQWHPGDPGDPNRHVDDVTRLRNCAAQQLGTSQALRPHSPTGPA